MKKIVRSIIFLAGLVILIRGISYIVTPKDSAEKLNSFFREEQDFDVLFLGISHMEVGVHPLEMWNDFGFTSFDFGESGNTIDSSYWVLRNALDYTTPKLVVIDVRHMDLKEREDFAHYFRFNYDRFPLSRNKIAAALELMPSKEKALELLFPVLQFHNRWNSLKAKDLSLSVTERIDRGSYRYKKPKVAVPRISEGADTLKARESEAYAASYLRRTIELCRDRGIEVLLTELPYPADRESREYANGVQAIADEYGIRYLNFLEEDKIGVIDFDTDMKDRSSHVNESGARKVSGYLGAYIREHYQLPDHRADEAYASWQQDYSDYTLYKEKRILSQKSPDLTLMLLSDKNISSCIYVKGSSPALTDERLRGLIRNIAQTAAFPETSEEAEAAGDALARAASEQADFFALFDNRGRAVYTAVGEAALDLAVSGTPLRYEGDGAGAFSIKSGALTIGPEDLGKGDICAFFYESGGTPSDPMVFQTSLPSSLVGGTRLS
ncbi:MAG: hypothetical protein IJJ38_06195 [Lachnospiraceae bacterium]|nr:hypothetical protein [Lachnospiraceae bacterium]